MAVILRLALRNLREHKAKTIIISLFILFGTAIVILGNSFIESVNRGLEKDFRANYTGDITISALPPEGKKIDIIGVQNNTFNGELPQLPALADIKQVERILSERSDIACQTKMISAKAMMVKGEEFDFTSILEDDSVSFSDIPIFMLYAGEKDTYFSTFPGQHIVDGRMLDYDSGENELLIDMQIKRSFEKFYKDTLNVGDKVLVAGANTSGAVREAEVVGFYEPANVHSAMFQTIYCTPDFARAFGDLTYASIASADGDDSLAGITELSEDELFGDDDLFGDMISEDDSLLADENIDFNSILGDTSLRDELNKSAEGSWHFVQAKAKNPRSADRIVAELNKAFEKEGISARAMNWKNAARSYTDTVTGINILFNILVIILAVVVFIIIMNTMVVSVIERTSEIGTMRAIGTEKNFVRLLFYAESGTITVISSVLGSIVAFIVIAIVNSMGLSVDNMIAKVILGGGSIHFTPTPAIVLLTIVIAFLGSLASNLYPVSSALKITPLKALSKGGE